MSRQNKKKTINVTKYVPKRSQAKQLEAEKRKKILLLVENLMLREEATFKMIIDCLYDVGSVNLINKNFTIRPLNQVMKLIAKLPKPAFRFLAFYWVRNNTPKLITNWLLNKVKF
ncbi:MAG TPA: hypothetical protein DCF68_12730 [Cyanothece sp. UBA12306]|nr:hypothetical protein [Cyanothece sp. UBA12306]